MIEIDCTTDVIASNDLSKPFFLTNDQRNMIFHKKEEIEKSLGELKCIPHLTHRTIVKAIFHNNKWEWEIIKCCCDDLDKKIIEKLTASGLVTNSDVVYRQDEYPTQVDRP
jgi:hypothetical protein